MMRRCLALFVLAPLGAATAAGCGEIKTAGEDGGSGIDGAPTAADAGFPGDPLNGTWHWWIGPAETPDSTCDVTIGAGDFEVYCPSDPYEVATDCMRTKNDTRIQGSWHTAFDGTFDEIERYEGAGCAAVGHPDTDVDLVTQGVLAMEAAQSETSDEPGFLPLAFGAWDWAIWEAATPDDRFGCTVSFAPGDSAASVAFRVDCVAAPDTPVPDCTHNEATVIEGSIDAQQMISEGWSEDRYAGAGCDPDYPDPVVEGEHAPMGATHE